MGPVSGPGLALFLQQSAVVVWLGSSDKPQNSLSRRRKVSAVACGQGDKRATISGSNACQEYGLSASDRTLSEARGILARTSECVEASHTVRNTP